MQYVIEIIKFPNGRQIINGMKKDSLCVEYGCITDLASVQQAEQAMRKRWDIKGNIKIEDNGILVGVLNG